MKHISTLFVMGYIASVHAETCEPIRLTVIQKIQPRVYEVRVGGSWPAILQTHTIEFTANGPSVVWAKQVGSKTLPTTNGFSEEYKMIEQCPPDGHWSKQ